MFGKKKRKLKIGLEIESYFSPSTKKQKELVEEHGEVESIEKLRNRVLYGIIYNIDFVVAVEENYNSMELIFTPVTMDEWATQRKHILKRILSSMKKAGFIFKVKVIPLGIHYTMDIIDYRPTWMRNFMNNIFVTRDMLLSISQRKGANTQYADYERYLSGKMEQVDYFMLKEKHDIFTEIMIDGFVNNIPTNIAGIRLFSNNKPVIELTWFGSTDSVNDIFVQMQYVFAIYVISLEKTTSSVQEFVSWLGNNEKVFVNLISFLKKKEIY